MAFIYDPIELRRGTVAPGTYPVHVLAAEESESTNGNKAFVLEMEIEIDGSKDTITRWLFLPKDADDKRAHYLLSELCTIAGHDYTTGKMAVTDIVGAKGYVTLVERTSATGDTFTNIRSFTPQEPEAADGSTPDAATGSVNSDLPF